MDITMTNLKNHARVLLRKFKGENYVFGNNCISDTGKLVGTVNRKVSLVISDAEKAWKQPYLEIIYRSLSEAGVNIAGDVIYGAEPNVPRADVFRIAGELEKKPPVL
jgi:alcohol dehydrogenase class IV